MALRVAPKHEVIRLRACVHPGLAEDTQSTSRIVAPAFKAAFSIFGGVVHDVLYGKLALSGTSTQALPGRAERDPVTATSFR